ncbi:hypothetical protein [Dyadobacter sp. 3J3]|uniref:hypothetical protein n=1 Tax=Dyadobacter sp. 3J3 TaxID=2606600 RepID=UPI00135CBD6A|nr:hypothetical protein [Dyadobacter sp. 3J3]
MKTLNQQLQEIYQTYLNGIYSQPESWDDGVSAPLLMNVFSDYEKMERKILFVGQETHSWEQMNLKPTLQELQTKYLNFNLGKSADYKDGSRLRYLTSPFWNFSRTLFHNLNKANLEVTRKTNGFLWTNISKFDCGSTTPDFKLQKDNPAGFHLLKEEVSILKPDIVVFLTGTKYDCWIDTVFNPKREVIISEGFLTKFSVGDGSLPELTFQTKHPRTLIGSKKKNIANRYKEVIDKLTNSVMYP